MIEYEVKPRHRKITRADFVAMVGSASRWILYAAGLYAFLGTFLCLIGQGVVWLKAGYWPEVPALLIFVDRYWLQRNNAYLADFLAAIPAYPLPPDSWLFNPTSWFGLHRLTRWILGLHAYTFMGIVIACVGGPARLLYMALEANLKNREAKEATTLEKDGRSEADVSG